LSLLKISGVNAWYGKNQALQGINLDIPKNCIYAFIGPSGCGKTTLLRSINRLNDFVKGFRLEGNIEIDGVNAYSNNDPAFVSGLRREIGMVFQHTNPLPMTIMQNMLLPIKEHYRESGAEMRQKAMKKLEEASILEEVEDRLNVSAMKLSGGQQQRLCIARALMLEPKLLLLDEPCSALDPVSTSRIEQLLLTLREHYTIVMVTHNMEQARRISDYTAFFYRGKIVETGNTLDMFAFPQKELTQNYLTGRF